MMKRSRASGVGTKVLMSLILCGALVTGPLSASGGTIRVPADQPTIQAAVDAAASGDEVLVAAGRYTGSGNKNIQIQVKDVAVRSEGGAAVTVIDCEGSGRAFFIAGANAPLAVIEGFTIENGDGNGADQIGGGGMFIGGGSPIIRNCIFIRNIAGDTYSGAGGGGGLVSHGSTATIEDCTFEDNSSAFHGGGLASHTSSLTIRRCQFLRNSTPIGWGGGAFIGEVSPLAPNTIEDCEFVDNVAKSYGGAIMTQSRTSRLLVKGNTARSGVGGIAAVFSTVNECTIMENSTLRLAGGIELGESQLTNTTIVSNHAEYGGGVWINAMGACLVENCTIADNVATEAGGGLMCYGRFPSIIRSSTFVRNSAPVGSGLGFSAIIHSAENTLESSIVTLGDGPAIVCYGTSSVTVSCTDIFGNRDGNWVGCIASFAGIDGNLEADPRFCNPKADWSLCAESPCAPGQSGACGQIGAFGTGCSCPIAVEPTTWGKIKANYE